MVSRPFYILIVPLGPKFDFRTSCRPRAALMLIMSAWPRLATSAFGFMAETAVEDIRGKAKRNFCIVGATVGH